MAGVTAPSIPQLREAHDSLRSGGLRNLALEASADHPVEEMQKQYLKTSFDNDMFRVERVYGRAVAWEKRVERSVLSQVQRLPGIPSAHIGVDHVLGRDTKIGWEDIMGLPENRTKQPFLGVHEVMERKLGMF